MKQKGATGGDLILVKVSGDLIDKTEGIAQGMSGSPVYINGNFWVPLRMDSRSRGTYRYGDSYFRYA